MVEKSLKNNAILNTIKTLCNIIFPLLTFPYISRVLLPNNIGKINFSQAFVNYFALIASLGITTYAIRECATKKDDSNALSNVASQIFSINLITTVIAYFLLTMALFFFQSLEPYRKLILIQSTTIIFTTIGCEWINTAIEDLKFITIISILFQVISIILMLILVKDSDDYIKYAIITAISSSGANFINFFYKRKYCKIVFVFNIEWKKHFTQIIMLFAMILAQTIFNCSDTTMLGLMKSDYEVGIYSTAVKITNLVMQIMASLAWVIMPRMSFYFNNNDYNNINILLKKIFGIFVTFGVPCAIGCMCLAKEIIFITVGDQYLEATPAFIILMIGFLCNLMGGAFWGNLTLLPAKREVVFMKICCVSTIINIVLNFLLIPIGGAIAASFTTSLSHFLIMIMCIAARDKKIKINGIKQLLKQTCIGCVVIIIICNLIKLLCHNIILATLLSIICSVILYFVILILFKNNTIFEVLKLMKVGKINGNI